MGLILISFLSKPKLLTTALCYRRSFKNTGGLECNVEYDWSLELLCVEGVRMVGDDIRKVNRGQK